MNWWFGLDVTRICVIVLVVTFFTILWVYVNVVVRGNRPDQPNQYAPFQPIQRSINSQPESKKSHKNNKKKNKQVDAVHNESQVANRRTKNTLLSNSQSQNVNSNIGSKDARNEKTKPVDKQEQGTRQGTKQGGNKGKQLIMQAQVTPMPSNKQTSGIEDVGRGDIEGGWQTRLSRPQMRALRREQHLNKGNGGNRLLTGEATNGYKQKDGKHQFNGNKKSHLVDNEDHQKGDKVKCRETVPAPVSTVTNSTILDVNERTDLEEKTESSSPEVCLLTSIAIGDVETALREAACGSLSSTEDKNATHSDSSKKVKKQKKSRRRDVVIPETEALGDVVDKQEEWVII